ncbi:DUF6630 family protein [Chitinibacteraceae bacterium HSL-7]
MAETLEQTTLAALEQLVGVISKDPEQASGYVAQLRALDADELEEEPVWVLKDLIDWEAGFFVDWSDTESFVQCLTDLAQARGASLTFGVEAALDDAFLDEADVAGLMVTAHDELLPQGWLLWNWDTEGDCYGGWLTRSGDADVVRACAAVLGCEMRTGAQPF